METGLTILLMCVIGFSIAYMQHKRIPSKDNLTEVELKHPPEAPKQPVEEAKPPKNYIRLWALAIQEFEGYKPGSASYRRNNPGNIKGLDGKFIVFPSYELGILALEDYLTRVCTGKHKAYTPSMTVYQVMKTYAPDPEPIPTNYAKHCAKAMGVTVDTVVSTLV